MSVKSVCVHARTVSRIMFMAWASRQGGRGNLGGRNHSSVRIFLIHRDSAPNIRENIPFFLLFAGTDACFLFMLVVEWSGNETCTFWDCYNMFAFIVQQPRGGHQ